MRMPLQNGYYSYRAIRDKWYGIDIDERLVSSPQRKILLLDIKEGSEYLAPTDENGLYLLEPAERSNFETRLKWRRRIYERSSNEAEHEKGDDNNRGRVVHVPRAVSPSTKREPLVKLTDDPVESGKELARADEMLPSDAWRAGGGGVDRGVKIVSREDKEMEDLRRAIAASVEEEEEEMRRRGSETDETPLYSVRVTPLKKGAKARKQVEGSSCPAEYGKAVQSALVVEEVGEEPVSWDDDIFQELEAQGWVPVDGWEEGELAEDELASIAESWIMARSGDQG